MLTRRAHGFTLIEVMIAVTILSIVTVMAMPMFLGMAASGRIRTSAEAFQNGISMARAEAVRQNTPVAFTIDGTGWQVVRLSDNAVLRQGSGIEGAAGIVTTPTPTGSKTIAFDVFGFVSSPNPDGTDPLSSIDFDVPNGEDLGSARRVLRVQVNTGGEIKLCDPAVATTDTRACI